MTDSKSPSKSKSPSSTAELVQTSKTASVELSERELGAVAGGKAKTADKNFTAMDAYIRG